MCLLQLKLSLDKYKWIVAWVDAHAELCAGKFEQELRMCREMVQLLPAKMDQLAAS